MIPTNHKDAQRGKKRHKDVLRLRRHLATATSSTTYRCRGRMLPLQTRHATEADAAAFIRGVARGQHKPRLFNESLHNFKNTQYYGSIGIGTHTPLQHVPIPLA